MGKPSYLGVLVVELSKLVLYETKDDKSQQPFGRENLQLLHMDCDSFVLSIRTKNNNSDLKNLEHFFDSSNLGKYHELFIDNKNKVAGNFKIESPEKFWIDEFIALRSKACSLNCNDKNTIKLKGISKSEIIQITFEEI